MCSLTKTTTALTTYNENQDPELWLTIAYDMATREPGLETDEDGAPVREPTTKWLARKYDLTPKQALGIITHPRFSEFIHQMQLAIAKVNFDRRAYEVLDEVIETGSNRERIAAVKLAAELLGYKSTHQGISLNFNFDAAVRAADSEDNKDVIDVEAYPGF